MDCILSLLIPTKYILLSHAFTLLLRAVNHYWGLPSRVVEAQVGNTAVSLRGQDISISRAHDPIWISSSEKGLRLLEVEKLQASKFMIAQLCPASHTSPAAKLSLDTLPIELHLLVFQHLDPIESTCLGLSSRKLYHVHRCINGTVPLNVRRKGPNDLERVWVGLDQQQCRHCGIYRCELHAHLRTWIPEKYEYCYIRQIFGLTAELSGTERCYRNCPPVPSMCGRHPVHDGGEARRVGDHRTLNGGLAPDLALVDSKRMREMV